MPTAIALVIALACTGIAAAQQQGSPPRAAATVRPAAREVARVNGVPITDDRLTLAVAALMPLESFHLNVGDDKMAALRQKALDRLIDEELQFQDGVRRGITVATTAVDRRLAEVKRRYGTPQNFEQAERQSGVTLSQLRREIRRSLTVAKAYGSTVTAKCQVGREEASQFFRDNPDRFLQPEQLRIYAITIGVDPSSPAARWAEAETQAEDVLGRIRRGASFEEMARTYSTDPSKTAGGDMGYAHRGTLNDDFEKATRDLPVGQASNVIRTLYGFHIVRVADIRPARRGTFAEVSAELRRDLTARRCTEMADAWKARLRANAVVVIADLAAAGESEAHGRTP